MSSKKPAARRNPRAKAAKPEEEDTGRPRAKDFFAPPTKVPPLHRARPQPVESEATASRVGQYDIKPAVLPKDLSRSLRLRTAAPFSEEVAAAASSSGYHTAKKALRRAAYQEATQQIKQDRVPKPPEPGSVSFSEQALRKAFQYYDLDKNDVVGAKELKHVFAMVGEAPTDQEIDGMIQLCDVRGEGQVSFEDFLVIFSNPAESLRNVDVEALKQVVYGNPDAEESSDDDIEDLSSSQGSGGSSP